MVWGFSAIVEEMHPHHIQRKLRSLPADGVAVARQCDPALFHSTAVRHGDMHGTYRFFLAAAARSGDSGDADAQRASHTTPNPARQRYGDLGADRAFCRD